ncbi:PEP-CTERM sorting domain-containing protein [Neorhodopirellula lusitana]|uniref:PEP-CTERM sorting domain-containing protein n=1 Tax=Neorhodopirellula lusitana TaxID=445327 RepID=UPI00384DD828
MLNCIRTLAAVALLSATSFTADAALVISGEVQEFAGAGTYTLDIFGTAVGQAETIGGWNISLDFSDPNLTFQSVAYASDYETVLPVASGSDPALLQATDTNFVGQDFALGDTNTLASITFNAADLGAAPISPVLFTDAFFGGVDFSLDPGAPGLALTPAAVPEPSSFAVLAVLGMVGGAIRRRKARKAQKKA